MEIIVINPFVSTEPHFEEIGLITGLQSVLWNIQLYDCFFSWLSLLRRNLTWLKKQGRFLLCRADDVEDSDHPHTTTTRW